MKTFGCIDWLTCTFPDTVPRAAVLPPNIDLGEFTDVGHGSEGYKQAWRADCGALIRSEGNANMGMNLMLPGDALALIRAQGMSEREFLTSVLARGGKPSRLDVAIDIFDAAVISPGWFEARFRAGDIITPARSMKSRSDTDGTNETGEGRYLGSRQSDRYLRLYDKGLEQKSDERGKWLRIELETHREQARVTMDMLAEHERTRQVINRAIAAYANVNDPEYQEMLADQSPALEGVPRKSHDFIRWFAGQVIPASVTYQLSHTSVNILTIFEVLFKDEIARRQPPKNVD